MTKVKVLNSEEGYNLAADRYDEKEKYLASFEKNQLIPLLGDVTNKKILDVAAGTGRIAAILVKNGAQVTALDISSAMLEALKKKIKNPIEIVRGDGEQLPFSDNTFDFVVATFFIVHLKNPFFFFKESYRVLKPEGTLLVTNINQKEAPIIKTKIGAIKIESYYHQPKEIINQLKDLAFCIEKELIIKEQEQWINQIIAARK